MSDPILAILWAQWRTLLNFRRGNSMGSFVLPALAILAWYGMWAMLAVAIGFFVSQPGVRRILPLVLPNGLLAVFVYWQLTPLLTASMGASIDLRKLLVFPIPARRLFEVEVLLRLSTCIEMMLLVSGLAAGLLVNPALPHRKGTLAVLPFVVFNLLVSAGLRNQMERWMARRRVRELIVLLILLAAAVPQLLFVTGVPGPLRRFVSAQAQMWWPWSATARLASGEGTAALWLILLGWTIAALFFGRWQFARSLRFDAAAAESKGRTSGESRPWLDRFYRVPGMLFSDPLAVIIEKELRSLFRTPRFRLVFLMGFTFGVIVFLPIILRRGGGPLPPGDHLAMVSGYALLLLGDVAFWNVFGFDRSAAQIYFLLPMPISRVFAGKNIAALFFVFLEITAIICVWAAFRMPLTAVKAAEAYAVALTFSLYLLGAGNVSSVYYPRAINPERSTGAASAGRLRAMLLLIYPAAAIPILLAYGARYAFTSDTAFWSVIAIAAALGAAFYWVALDSALERIERNKDRILRTLSEDEGPVRLS